MNEREAFENFVRGAGGHTVRRADGSYVSSMTELWWKCWQARAALSAPAAPVIPQGVMGIPPRGSASVTIKPGLSQNAPAAQVGYVAIGRNPFYEGLFHGETEEQRDQRIEDARIAERMTKESLAAALPVEALTDEIVRIMEAWKGVNGGVYTINGCAKEIVRALLATRTGEPK